MPPLASGAKDLCNTALRGSMTSCAQGGRAASRMSGSPLCHRTLSRKPAGGTHWSIRQAADASQISKSTVHRFSPLFAVPPHRSRKFKLSTDPFFIEKVRDIAGLYLNPPDHALVLCVDEKSRFRP